MHRIDEAGHVGNLFTEGVPGVSPATKVGDDWLNAVQEENAGVVEGAGLALVKANNFQLLQAINLLTLGITPGGRLTLLMAVPVSIADQASKTTVYYTPHRSTRVVLFDGTKWVSKVFAELSQATTDATKSPAAVANNSNYDVFVWDDAGTLRATRGPAWTSDTGRGAGAGTTELELLNGRLVNKVLIVNGPPAQRGLYVGSIRSDGSAQINDTHAKRHVWNTYNRVIRPMSVITSAGPWNYSTAAWRQANADAANQLDFLLGLQEDGVLAHLHVACRNSTATYRTVSSAIGLDSTTVPVPVTDGGLNSGGDVNNAPAQRFVSQYAYYPGLGRHFLAWLEFGAGTDTQTWAEATGVPRHGIQGAVQA